MRPLKKIKMNRIFKALSLLSIIALLFACKKEDDVTITPPRDQGEQYATEKILIEEYLKSHYVTVDPETLDATFAAIPEGGAQESIWDQTAYPLQNIQVNRNEVTYTVYYLSFREGVADAPTMADNVLVTYRGTTLEGTQFDYQPFASSESSLTNLISGWGDIIPLFKSGLYVNENPGDPASFTDYGAGAMFLPSGLAYFNSSPSSLIPAYSPLVFAFQLLDVTYTDVDGDGIQNRYETIDGLRLDAYDSDGDGTPNYLDVDDDNDGRLTKDELRDPNNPTIIYSYEDLFNEDGTVKPEHLCEGGILPKYLDPSCKGGQN